MKIMKLLSKLLFLALIFLLGSSCFHIELAHYGTVTDAETLEPLSGVQVYERLEYECLLPPNPGGTSSKPLGNISATSNVKGEYKLPFKIFMKPPLFCGVSKVIGFIKPGYFQDGYRLEESSEKGLKEPQEIKLFKMTHYLNILPYTDKDKYHYSFEFENMPGNYLNAFDSIKNLRTTALDDMGIFARLKNKQLSRICYFKKHKENIIYGYDNITNNWVAIDFRGKTAERTDNNIPNWLYVSQYGSSNWTIYADKDNIYYYPYYNPMPVGSNYGENDIIIIPAKIGDISAITGYAEMFITIENNGQSLCHYGRQHTINDEPTFLEELTGLDLPTSKEDDSVVDSKFMYLSSSMDSHYLLTKTNKYWHIYNINIKRGKSITRDDFYEIGIIPLEKNFSSFVSYGNKYTAQFFFTVKDEGIKIYKIENNKFKQVLLSNIFDKDFYRNISAMTIGYLDRFPVIYAVAGDERIFRFTMDGISDYPIKFSQLPD